MSSDAGDGVGVEADPLVVGERALHVEGNLVAARSAFDAAYARAERDGDVEALARAALGMGGIWVHERRGVSEARRVAALQSRAVARLRDVRCETGASLTLRLRTRLAAEAEYRAARPDSVLRLLRQARARGELVPLAEALSLAHHCLLGPEHGAARLALAEELIAVAAGTDRPSDLVMGLVWRVVDLFLCGDRQAERAFADLLEHEPATRNAAAAYALRAIRVMLTIRAGRLPEAELMAEECARSGAAVGDPDWMGWYAAQLLSVRWFQGRIGDVVDTVATVVNSPTLSVVDYSLLAVQAVACAAAGQTRPARGALARIVGRDLADLPSSSSWLPTMAAVIEAAALLDDVPAAARAYELLVPYRDLPVMASLAVSCLGSAHQPLGVACLVTGQVDCAVQHLKAAVAHNAALGHWPAMVLARHRLARGLTVRGGAADARRAGQLRAEAVAEAAEFGMSLPAVDVRGGRRPVAPVAACTRAGRRWRVELRGRSTVVDDMVGMRHLEVLIANPDVDIPALELASTRCGPRVSLSPQRVLDDQAVRQFRSRLSDLAVAVEGALAAGEQERVASLRAEAEWLRRELGMATGLAGRPRSFADDAERARIAVGKAIRRAMEKVAAADAVIGEELPACVETGAVCCYRPGGSAVPIRTEDPAVTPAATAAGGVNNAIRRRWPSG